MSDFKPFTVIEVTSKLNPQLVDVVVLIESVAHGRTFRLWHPYADETWAIDDEELFDAWAVKVLAVPADDVMGLIMSAYRLGFQHRRSGLDEADSESVIAAVKGEH